MASSVSTPHTRQRSKAPFILPSSSSSSNAGTDDVGIDKSDDDDDDDVPLPFPEALPRSDFLSPNFDPAAYLSALPHRHQTLEDLRSDLRERSTAISSELLELVNANYTAFLSLGNELRGGDEKVDSVKVSLLGFRRAVEEVKGRVGGREQEMRELGADLKSVRGEMERGRAMLEISERLTALEERLAVDSLPGGSNSDDDLDDSDVEDDEEEGKVDGLHASSPAKFAESAKACRQIQRAKGRLDEGHPVVLKLTERLTRCRNTLLLDLGHALREAKQAGGKGQARLMKYLSIYRSLDAQDEAIKVLRGG